MRNSVRSLTVVSAILAASSLSILQAQLPSTLPVYQVVDTGLTAIQTRQLATALKLSFDQLPATSGSASFTDPVKFLRVPHAAITDAPTVRRLSEQAVTPVAVTPAQFYSVDVEGVNRLNVLDEKVAIKTATDAFTAAGVHFESATPIVSHTVYSASFTNDAGAPVSVEKQLDTRVHYEWKLAGGTPLIGPGAVADVTFAEDGTVSNLRYAARTLKQGPSVKLLSEASVRERLASHLPAGATLDLHLVYWAPSLEVTPGRAAALAPTTIIPMYAYSVTTRLSGLARNIDPVIHSKIRMIPAVDDVAYVPAPRLTISGQGTDQLTARVEVSGGRGPYTYVWAGSDPAVSTAREPSIHYSPLRRDLPQTTTSRPVSETVSVTVIDANGVAVELSQTVPALFHLIPATLPTSAPTANGISKGIAVANYGTESPREPDFAIDRVGWQTGMANNGGGPQKYAWLAASAWPGDFINPPVQGSLPATPWINGDSDYSNWGINTAAIVLNNTDGSPDLFASSNPGAVIANYATAELIAPYAATTVQTGLQGYNTVAGSVASNINYKGSWGPVGTFNHLFWLAMDACDILDTTDGSGLTSGQRWGPAFGGLHIMTGWSTTEQVGDGSFEKNFAENFLGVGKTAQTIYQAWFNAATTAGSGHGSAAAMGPIGAGNVDDQGDFYLGKGSQGPTLTGSAIKGFWYVHQ